MFSVSVFLVMQSLQAMLFRILLLVVPGLLAWWFAGAVGTVGRASFQRRLATSVGPR
jgi:hypothetical protein